MVVTKSINVQVDGYLPSIAYSRLEDPPMCLFHKEGKTLNIPKDATASDNGNSNPVSIDVRTIPKIEHPVTEDVQTIEGARQHQNNHDIARHADIQAQEPSRKIRKNHPTTNIIRDP